MLLMVLCLASFVSSMVSLSGTHARQCSLRRTFQTNVPEQQSGPGYLETLTISHFEDLFIILNNFSITISPSAF